MPLTLAELRQALVALPAEERQLLLTGLRGYERQEQKNRRDEALCKLASKIPTKTETCRAKALAIAARLSLYAAGPWRFEQGGPEPSDDVHALLHTVLTYGDGTAPKYETIRKILDGRR